MAQVITLAGERLFALKAQNNQQLDIDTFIFAYVPGQDSTVDIDRNEGLPPIGQRVHTQIVQQYGMINENAVVYSSVLDSLTGPFQFNWVGLYSAVNQTLIAIQHIPTVSKTVTEPGASGNILNRNFVIEYSGIAELTGITVDPATWQLDYTARLNGMDELTRQLAADMNGKDWFIDDGFKVVPRSTLNTFKVTAGVGYVSGLRVTLAADHILTLSSYPQFVYVDAWFDGTSESVWKGQTAFTVTNTEMDDYIDVNGRNHYVFKLARITAADVVEDLRNVNGLGQKIKKALITSTVDEVFSGVFDTGTHVYLSERGNAAALVQSGSDANGETILNAGDGKIAVVDDAFLSRAETYSSIQAAVNNAKALGIKVLNVDSDIDSSEEIQNRGSVALIGKGRLTGVYRKRVAKETDPSYISFNDIKPESHLKRFLSKTEPVVVIVGDSIATENGGNIPMIESLSSRIHSKLVKSYPNKNIKFFNRAIGGETYFTAVGTPSNFPAWYTDIARGWPAYVGDLNPDLVIFNFGMNDSSNLHTNKLKVYQTLLDNTAIFPAGRPDVIYCTNLTPAIDSTFAGLGTAAGQSGRDLVAGYTRSFAKAVGAGLLDFHRQCTIVKDGYDPTDTFLEFVGPIVPVDGAVSATAFACTDFKWDLTLTLPVGNNIAVRLGAPSDTVIDPTGRGSYAVVYNNGGNFKVDFFTADITRPDNIYASFETLVPIPVGNFVLTVEKKQESALFAINGAIATVFSKLLVAGADVPPKAGDSNYLTGSIISANLWVGRYKTYKQSVVNNDMWGLSDNTAVQRGPFGGNGANHPSSIGSAAVFQPVLDSADFSGASFMSVDATPMNGWSNIAGQAKSKAHRHGDLVTIHFTMAIPTAGVAAKGVFLNVPEGFRPKAGISALAVAQTPADVNVQCNISSNGDIELFTFIDNYVWGTITFSV